MLTDRNKRDKYDNGYDLEDINSGRADFGGMGGGMGGIDPNDLMRMFMGGGGMGGSPFGGAFGGMGGSRGGGGQQFTFRF